MKRSFTPRLALRTTAVLVALQISSSALWALSGRVLLEVTGEPLRNAEVTVLGRTGAALTDAEGYFVLEPTPPVPFEILVILPGERYMKPVLIESLPEEGEPLVVRVGPLVQESVTVTAGAAPDIEASPASGNTLLSRTEVEVRQPVNLMQALENVPGVNKVSEGQAAVPAVRGLARGRTLILIDGARVTSERRVGPSATYLDPFALESLQVSRGPGSVAYGSDAFGGVIHARTRRPVPGEPFRLRFIGSLGAGEPQQRVGAEVSRGFSSGGILFQGHYRDFDDYRSPEGTVFNSGATDQGFLVRAEQIVAGGLLSVAFQGDYGRDIERPRTNSRSTRFYYPIEDSNRFTASYDVGPGFGLNRFTLSTFLGGYRIMTDQDSFATETAPRAIERADVDANDFHVRATAEKVLGEARLDFGLDLNGRYDLRAEDVFIDFDPSGEEIGRVVDPTIDNANRTDTGLFVSAESAVVPRLSLAGGARVDRVTTSNRGGYFGDRSTSNAAFSGYASATLGSFAGFSLTGQVARGFRDPVISDRYFRGVTGRGFITGNPELEPETSTQFDTALRYTGRGFRGAFYFYEYRFQDLIERYEDEPDFFLFRNRGRARIRGIELEAQAELPREVTLQLAFQKQNGISLDDDAALDDISPVTFVVQVRKELGSRAFVQVRGALYASDERPGPTEVDLPGYGVLDFSAGFRFDERLELRFLGRNLFDATYPVSPDRRAVPAPGVSGLVTLLVRL
jgi:outer membrane receptor protein involved in Fe transport